MCVCASKCNVDSIRLFTSFGKLQALLFHGRTLFELTHVQPRYSAWCKKSRATLYNQCFLLANNVTNVSEPLWFDKTNTSLFPIPSSRSAPPEPRHLCGSLKPGGSSWCGPAHFLSPQIPAPLIDLIGQKRRPSPASPCSSWRSAA